MRMGNRLKLPAIVLIAAFTLMSCEWLLPLLSELGDGEPEPYTTHEVYTAGYFNDGTRNVACYWRDAERVALEDGVESEAFDIALDGAGGVYVAGYYNEGSGDLPCVWYNGERNRLDAIVGRAESIALTAAGYGVVGTLESGESSGAFFVTEGGWLETLSPAAWGVAVAASDNEFVYLWSERQDRVVSTLNFYGGGTSRSDVVLPEGEEYRDVARDDENCYVVGNELEIADDGVMYRRSMLWTVDETDATQTTVIRETSAPEPQIAVYNTAVSVQVTEGTVSVNGYGEDGFYRDKEDSYLWRDGNRSIVSALQQWRHVADHAIAGSLSWLCGGYDPDYGAQRAWYAYREGFGYSFVDLSEDVESEARAMALRAVTVYPE